MASISIDLSAKLVEEISKGKAEALAYEALQFWPTN